MAVSVEIRHVIVGECDCGVPKYSWEHTNHDHYWECDYGIIPSFDIENPAPLIITSRSWVHCILYGSGGGSMSANSKDRHDVVTVLDDGRLLLRIDYDGRSWTWVLEPAHWDEPPSRYNDAHIPIYLGRWPD